MNLPDFLRRDDLGEVLLAGHRVTLYHAVKAYKEAGSAEALVAALPSIPLTLARKVIAHYLENRAEVDAYLDENRKEIDRQAALPSRGPSFDELKRRLEIQRQAESA